MESGSPLRILFAGTPQFSVPPLQRLIADGYTPLAVLTQPDRPAGRGRQLQASPVKQVASEAGIPVLQPATLRDPKALQQLADFAPDLMVVVAYGLILPTAVLQLPRHGCWNIHASLLPRWRGAAPIQRAIEAGDRQTGICIMEIDEGLDTGPVLLRSATPIGAQETAGELHDRLAQLGSDGLLQCLRELEAGNPPRPQPQPETGVTYARKLDKAEARIDWTEPAGLLQRRVRAFNPWPVAWCMVGTERTRVWASRVSPLRSSGQPGEVLAAGKDGIDVATGQGVLRLLELQRPGKRRTSIADYLNAMSLPPRLDGGG
jgi:methionyl-tRNA formyltransferase